MCTRVLYAQREGKGKLQGNRSIKQGKKCTVVDRQHFDTNLDPDPDPILYQPGQVNTVLYKRKVCVIGLQQDQIKIFFKSFCNAKSIYVIKQRL